MKTLVIDMPDIQYSVHGLPAYIKSGVFQQIHMHYKACVFQCVLYNIFHSFNRKRFDQNLNNVRISTDFSQLTSYSSIKREFWGRLIFLYIV